jgi:hypothetical protein
LVAFAGCKKDKKPEPQPGYVNLEGLEIHRAGGLAGFQDHYLIKDNKVKQSKDFRYSSDYKWEIELPKEKYDQAKAILNDVPAWLLSAPNPPYAGPPVSDMMGGGVVMYYNGKTYELDFANITDQPFADRVNATLEVLTAP